MGFRLSWSHPNPKVYITQDVVTFFAWRISLNMKFTTTAIIFFLISCSDKFNEDHMSRAVQDENAQNIISEFERHTDVLFYNPILKNRAALTATKAPLPDYSTYFKLDSLFRNTKTNVLKMQNEFMERNTGIIVPNGNVFPTSQCAHWLNAQVQFDFEALRSLILSTIYTSYKLNREDTLIQFYPTEFAMELNRNRNYPWIEFKRDISEIVSKFLRFNCSDNMVFIEVMEYFTMCRSVLLLVERKMMRFHAESLNTQVQFKRENDLRIVSSTENIVYSPNSHVNLKADIVLLFESKNDRKRWMIDSGEFNFTPSTKLYSHDTVWLNTSTVGHHCLQVKYYNSKNSMDLNWNYLVLEK